MLGRKLIITCEHGGNEVPEALRYLFAGHEAVLDTHRGWDPGALPIAITLAKALGAPLHYQTISRLVIEMNRSLSQPELFSVYTAGLSQHQKGDLIAGYYYPYRNKVFEEIVDGIAQRKGVLHLSVHTFTSELNGEIRKADIGLLADEARGAEAVLVRQWQEVMTKQLPALNIMINSPYNGADDGFTTYLRTAFSQQEYLGVELEINQRLALSPAVEHVNRCLEKSLIGLLQPVS